MKEFPNYIEDETENVNKTDKEAPFIVINTKMGKVYYFALMLVISFFGNSVYYAVNSLS